MSDQQTALDVVTIGRSSVDLYGEQVGGRLEDMSGFAKYVGGCPTNIAIGTAKLGLKSGLITAVGDEHMGRFIREEVERWGVDTRFLKTDPSRLTSLVILGIRDKDTFPLIFFRENCADSALEPADIDEAYIASAKAVVVTGTHFSRPNLEAMSRKAAEHRPGAWAQGRLRHRLPAGALGPHRPRARRGALRRECPDQRRICRPSCRSATSSSAPRRSCTSPAARR